MTTIATTRTSIRTALRKAVDAELAARPLTRDERGALARAVREGVARVFGGDAPVFYRAAGITRFQYSKIVSHPERYHPSKDTVLRMALAFRFPPDEAAAFLALAGFALSPSLPADRVWSLCLERGLWHLSSVLRLLDKHANPAGRMLPARQHLAAGR